MEKCFTFKPVKCDELMKVEPDGKIFIQGKETTDSKEIARALYAFGMSLGEERDKLKQENASLTSALDLAVEALEYLKTQDENWTVSDKDDGFLMNFNTYIDEALTAIAQIRKEG